MLLALKRCGPCGRLFLPNLTFAKNKLMQPELFSLLCQSFGMTTLSLRDLRSHKRHDPPVLLVFNLSSFWTCQMPWSSMVPRSVGPLVWICSSVSPDGFQAFVHPMPRSDGSRFTNFSSVSNEEKGPSMFLRLLVVGKWKLVLWRRWPTINGWEFGSSFSG
jgi:hypothetical protein